MPNVLIQVRCSNMSKHRKRRPKNKKVQQPVAGALPVQVGSAVVGHPPGTLVSPQRFPSALSDLRPPGPPAMNHMPFLNQRFNLEMRPPMMYPRGFHPQNFAECQRYPPGIHPRFPNGPPAFRGWPSGYGPPEFRTGPQFPPDFRPGPPGFVPPDFRPGPPGFVPPEFRPGPPEFFPPDFRHGPPGFVPPEFRPGLLGFVPPEFQDRPPGFSLADKLQNFHQPVFGARPDRPVMDSAYQPVTVCTNKVMASDKLTTTQQKSQQTKSNENKGKNGSGENCTTKASSVKMDGFIVKSAVKSAKPPPPGRFTGVITFVDTEYGLIKGEDQKEFRFSLHAFFGDPELLIVGVKVHFTIVKNLDTECAADVKVAPGGTEIIDDPIYEGVVTVALPDNCLPSEYSGRLRTILDTKPINLQFGTYDAKCTLLLYDWVKFQLLTNVSTKIKRATNITPQMPETFRLTKEARDTGVIATIQNDNFTLTSKKHGNLSGSIREFISDQKLKVMDEVEFAYCSKGSPKAIRLIKVPKKESLQEKSADLKPKWKPLSPVVVAQGGGEEISSESYDGTVIQVIPKSSSNLEPEVEPQGIVEFTMMGTTMCLPFKSGDVVSQATMMIGDKVEFNIATKVQTREMHAINVEISPETFHTESQEQRKIGVVVKLDANSGFIKSQDYTQLRFDLSEVLEDAKLTLSEKVEFTIAVNEGIEKSEYAIRIRRLKKSVSTLVPKIKEKHEKKKNTIKVKTNLNDLVEEQVKTEENPVIKAVVSVKKEDRSKDRGRERNLDGSRERIRDNTRDGSRERSRRRHSRSSSRSRDSRNYKRQRSSSRDRSSRSQRRSGSRSRDRSRNYSRSRSRERYSQSHRQRSRSPDHSEKHRSRRRSRSPDHNTSRKTKETSPYAPAAETVDSELVKKRNELLALNELIARRKAIIAMEQSSLTCTDSLKLERQSELSHETPWLPEQKPVKSILKKHSEVATVLQNKDKKTNSAELEEYKKNYVSSLSLSSDSEALWFSQSSKIELVDPELMRKKKQLQDLSESIARKRAILAMEQNAKKIKIEYYDGDEEEEDNLERTETCIPKNKSNPHPKKSILKTRSGALDGSSQKDMTPADQYDSDHTLFSLSQSLQDDYSASTKSSEPPCSQSRKSHSRSPSTPSLFHKRLRKVSSRSHADKSSPFDNQAGQQSCPSTDDSQNPEFSQQASDPAQQSSTLGPKSGITKQMERFLGALSRADSSLLSSLIQEAKGDSASLAPQGSLESADHVVSSQEDLYDPSSPTDDHINSLPFIGINKRNPMQRRNKPNLDDYTQDDLLPHERAIQDGCGFSKIVGMKYGIDPTAENEFPFEEMAASSKQRLSSDDVFVKDKSLCNLSEKHYDPFCNEEKLPSELFTTPLSHAQGLNAEDDQISERQVALKKDRAEDTLGPVLQKSKENPEDVESKEGQYQKLQDLLQTIGLHLDTTEVNKLADRTRERLYGKKTKPQKASCHSLDKKNEKGDRYVRRGSSASTDSDGVVSVSPAKSSKREVYMSYLDSIRHSQGETAVNESGLKRTIINNPDVQQVTTESSPQITPTSYEPSLSAQTQTSMYTSSTSDYTPAEQYSWGMNYASNTNQNSSLVQPYSVAPQHHQQIASSYPMPYSYLPPSYDTYGRSNNPLTIMSPNPVQGYQSVSLLPSPGLLGKSPTSTYPSVSVQFDTSMLSCGSDYTTQQPVAKSTMPHRYLTQITTVNTKVKPPAQLLSIEESHRTNLVEKQETQPTNTEVETPASLIAEDDIKAKQKKRLEQFNQRMRQKKEQQMEAQRIRGEGKKLLQENTQKEVKNVWICGHSLIFWAEKRATSPELGMQLGMHPNTVRIWWKGVQGMTWEQLLPQLHQLKDNWPKPDVILIHLGGNDIGKSTPEDFVAAVQKDLISLKSIFPQCRLVWSDILPRKFWRHSDDSPTVNETRAAINRALHDVLLSLGGFSLSHENIKPTLDSGFYRPDGVHLSGKGIDTFNLNMQDFLEKWEHEVNKAGTSKD